MSDDHLLQVSLGPWLQAWDLVADGTPNRTRSSVLLPVRREGRPAILKMPLDEVERRGGRLMAWWAGDGAAPVLAEQDGTVLLDRAEGGRSLAAMARQDEDNEACQILAEVAGRLHRTRLGSAPELPKLVDCFRDLREIGADRGGILAQCAAMATALLADPQETTVLHGDLHHGNVLDFGDWGWLAIDPKGIVGERGFDYAALFANPDLADPTHPVATDPDRFARRLDVVAAAASLDRERLLRWVFAWSGLSTTWSLADGDTADIALRIAELARAELDR